MNNEEWKPGVVHLHIIPKPGERGFVSRHRCWNTDLFIAARREEYAKEGGVVAVIDEATYNAERTR